MAIYFFAAILLSLLVYSFFNIVSPVRRLWLNRYLYKYNLSREEQATIEGKLNRLARVIVMCDRVDPPTEGFLTAVKDNFKQGVTYQFLVSDRSSDDSMTKYIEMFQNIELSVRAEEKARSTLGKQPRLRPEPLFKFTKLRQDWHDYPYICYEFFETDDDLKPQYLMYRGNEIGVGISDTYVRISPETAYSLICRASALQNYIDGEEGRFVDGRRGGLENKPLHSNVIQMRSRQ